MSYYNHISLKLVTQVLMFCSWRYFWTNRKYYQLKQISDKAKFCGEDSRIFLNIFEFCGADNVQIQNIMCRLCRRFKIVQNHVQIMWEI